MTASANDFLLQGMTHYPDAHAAVREFRRVLAERVIARARAHAWRAWKPELRRWKATNSWPYGEWVGAGGPGRVEGTETELIVDVGVWWNAADLDVPRAFCLYVTSGPDAFRKGLPVPDDVGVEHVVTDAVYLFVRDDARVPDVDARFDRLFEAFDACVAGASARRPR